METKGCFQFVFIVNVLASYHPSFTVNVTVTKICIFMLFVYDHYTFVYSFSVGINFRRTNPTSIDARI